MSHKKASNLNHFTDDVFGTALLAYQKNQSRTNNIITYSSIAGKDEMSLKYLFRTYDNMPKIEQIALDNCFGNVLDIGCGSGCHSLSLQKKGLDCTALDISKGAVQTAKMRGVNKVVQKNIFEFEYKKFDTIIALMNGTGICGKLDKLTPFLQKLKSLLKENGQILIDSSDLIYMFDEDEITELSISKKYYGEVTFQMEFEGIISPPFPWLYVHFDLLKLHVFKAGLNCALLKNGNHYDYLAKLTHR